MPIPMQRETILKLLQDNADDNGRIKLSSDDIVKLTGIDIHDVTKTAWGLQKEQKLKFRERKAGSGSSGRTFSVLSNFELLPTAWPDGLQQRRAEKKAAERAEFAALVQSIQNAGPETLPEPVSAPIILPIPAKEPVLQPTPTSSTGYAMVRPRTGGTRHGPVVRAKDEGLIVNTSPGRNYWGTIVKQWDSKPSAEVIAEYSDRNLGGSPRPVSSPVVSNVNTSFSVVHPQPDGSLGYGRVRTKIGSIRRGFIDSYLPNGDAVIIDVSGRRREGPLVERWDTPPARYSLTPRKRRPNKTTKRGQQRYGKVTKPETNPVFTQAHEDLQAATELFEPKVVAKPETGIGIEGFAFVLRRDTYPLIAQVMERDGNLLVAAEALEKAGLKEEAERILGLSNAGRTPLELEVQSFMTELGIKLGS